jgi:hypothetical protein
MGIYQQGNALSLTASDQGARALLLAGTPIREPVAQHGPFGRLSKEYSMSDPIVFDVKPVAVHTGLPNTISCICPNFRLKRKDKNVV